MVRKTQNRIRVNERLNQIPFRRLNSLMSNTWVGYSVCLLGFILVTYSFYPGYMSPDTLSNFEQAKTGVFRDINSPIMSYVWGLTLFFSDGPFVMFLFQNLLFWSGITIFWRLAANRSALLGFFVAVSAWMPQTLSQLSTVWKDIALCSALLLASSLIFWASRKKLLIPLLFTPALLFYGLGARLNAFPAVLPLAVWSAFVIVRNLRLFRSGNRKRIIFSTAVGLSYFAFLASGVYLVNFYLTDGKTTYPYQQVLLYDLAAISKETGSSEFPSYITENRSYSLNQVQTEYNLRSVNSLIYVTRPNQAREPILLTTTDPEKISQLISRWRAAVTKHPGTYLLHRWNVFAQLIGLTRDTVSNPFWDPKFEMNPPRFRPEPNIMNLALTNYFQSLRKFPFFREFFWMLLSGFFLYRSVRARLKGDWEMIFFISLSSLAFVFAYFPTTPSTEFRYLFWSVTSSMITALFGGYLSLRRKTGSNKP